MLIIHLVIIGIFIALGLFFLLGKGRFLTGSNAYTQDRKDAYNERALCRFLGKVMFAYALCFAVVATSEYFGSLLPLWIGMGLFLGVTVFTLVYANTGHRFRK